MFYPSYVQDTKALIIISYFTTIYSCAVNFYFMIF